MIFDIMFQKHTKMSNQKVCLRCKWEITEPAITELTEYGKIFVCTECIQLICRSCGTLPVNERPVHTDNGEWSFICTACYKVRA
jgi:hypothetical protein